MDEKIRRLLNWFNGRKDFPYTLDINPTDKCNLKCKHCWQRAFKHIDSSYEISDKVWIKRIKEALNIRVKEFEITGGGEPLMRKDLTLKLIEIVKKGNTFGNITTNGTLFDEEDFKKLIKVRWDRITFSIEGPDKVSNDFIRGKGTFEKVMANLKILNKLKKRYKSKKPIVKFNVTVNIKNYDKLTKFIILARKVNCSIVHFDSLTVFTPLGKKLKLKTKHFKKFEEEAKRAQTLAKRLGIWTDIGDLTTNFLKQSNQMESILKNENKNDLNDFSLICYEPWWHLVIKTNGFAQPCCLYDEKVENIKSKSLKQIWFSKYFEEIRENIKNKKLPKFCSICNAGQVFENRRIRGELNKWMKK